MPDLFDEIETSSKKGDIFEGDLFDELTQKAPSPTWEALKKTAAVLPAQAAVTGREFLKGATLGVVDIPTPTAEAYLKEKEALPVHPYVKTAAHMLGEFLPIGAVMKIISPVVKFAMAGAGMVRTAATEAALTGFTYEAAKGAAQGKDPVETLKEMGYAGPQWAVLGAAAGKLGAVLSKAKKAKPEDVVADLAKAKEEIESTIIYKKPETEFKIAPEWQPKPEYPSIPYTETQEFQFKPSAETPMRIGPRPPEGGIEIPPMRQGPSPETKLLAPPPDWIPGKPITTRRPFLETPATAAEFKGPEKVFVESEKGPVEVKWNAEKKAYEPIPPTEKVVPSPLENLQSKWLENIKEAERHGWSDYEDVKAWRMAELIKDKLKRGKNAEEVLGEVERRLKREYETSKALKPTSMGQEFTPGRGVEPGPKEVPADIYSETRALNDFAEIKKALNAPRQWGDEGSFALPKKVPPAPSGEVPITVSGHDLNLSRKLEETLGLNAAEAATLVQAAKKNEIGGIEGLQKAALKLGAPANVDLTKISDIKFLSSTIKNFPELLPGVSRPPVETGKVGEILSEPAKRALIRIEGKTVNGLAQDILSETPAKQEAAINAVKKAVEEGKITQKDALEHFNNEMMNISHEKVLGGANLNATLEAAQRAGMAFTERIAKEVRPDAQAIFKKLRGEEPGMPRETLITLKKQGKDQSEYIITGAGWAKLKKNNYQLAAKLRLASTRETLGSKDQVRDLFYIDNTPRVIPRDAGFTTKDILNALKEESGKVDLDLLRHITISGLGAATGATLDEENRWRGAIIGGVTGFAISRGLLNKVLGKKFVAETPALAKEKIEVKPIREGPSIIEGALTQPIIRLEINKSVANATEDILKAAGMKYDPTLMITDQVATALKNMPAETFNKILGDVGISAQEFTNHLWRRSITNMASGVGTWGPVVKRLLRDNPEARKALDDISRAASDIDAMSSAQNWWKRVDNIRRGLLVTQLATAMRNAETQVGRIGIDVFEQALDAGLQRIFKRRVTTNPLDGLESLMTLFRRGKKADVEKILNFKDPNGNPLFEGEFDRLFLTYSSDIMRGRAEGIPEKIVDTLNVANRFQEYAIRRTVLLSKLDQRMRAINQDLGKIIERNEIGKISEDDVKYAVNQALEFTWAQSPKYGSLAADFIKTVNRWPGLTYLIPFPRFLMNSIKFQFNYSPLGAFKLLSSQERLAIKGGDMRTISRSILGTAMLGTAYQIRNSEYAGEKWYELNVGGRPIDTRAYNPFASYLFVADIIKKSRDGSLYKLTSSDIIQGLLSTNLRAGTGLYTVDRVLDLFTEEGKAEKGVNALKQFGGEVAAGFMTPIKQVRDFLYGFDDMVLKETRGEPFLGPIKATLPGIEKGMEPRYKPTRAEPAKWQAPGVRQATGISVGEPKNTLEKELDRLGFESREILPSVGDAKADNLIRQKMGSIAEEIGVPLLEDPSYRNMGEAEKGYFLSRMLAKFRTAAKKEAQGDNPELFEKIQRTPRRKEIFLKSLEGG